jgi:uncharacterized membrane protein YraQ (UPF0718 family)
MPSIPSPLVRRVPLLSFGIGLAVTLTVVAMPQHVLPAVRFALVNLALVSPVILIGVVVTATITATGSMALIAAAFHGRELRMICLAAMVGAFLPVCGVTVLPLVASLLVARVPLAPILAFWLASPVTSPGMLAVTAGMLGLDFAIGKSAAAVFIGVLGGLTVYALTRAGRLAHPARDIARLNATGNQLCQSSCGSSYTVRWRFWQEAARRRQFRHTALSTGRMIGTWLALAFVAEYAIKLVLPEDALSRFVGAENEFAVPIAATIGAPLYLDGHAALPLVRGLIEAGMTPGAAMAFLVAGGVVSAWSVIPVVALVRLPVVGLYIGLAVTGSFLAGWVYGLAVT